LELRKDPDPGIAYQLALLVFRDESDGDQHPEIVYLYNSDEPPCCGTFVLDGTPHPFRRCEWPDTVTVRLDAEFCRWITACTGSFPADLQRVPICYQLVVPTGPITSGCSEYAGTFDLTHQTVTTITEDACTSGVLSCQAWASTTGVILGDGTYAPLLAVRITDCAPSLDGVSCRYVLSLVKSGSTYQWWLMVQTYQGIGCDERTLVIYKSDVLAEVDVDLEGPVALTIDPAWEVRRAAFGFPTTLTVEPAAAP
jgi:hypothetical protein